MGKLENRSGAGQWSKRRRTVQGNKEFNLPTLDFGVFLTSKGISPGGSQMWTLEYGRESWTQERGG